MYLFIKFILSFEIDQIVHYSTVVFINFNSTISSKIANSNTKNEKMVDKADEEKTHTSFDK